MNGYIRCSFCYATGYKVTTHGVTAEVASGRITNQKCKHCNGSGYTIIDTTV